MAPEWYPDCTVFCVWFAYRNLLFFRTHGKERCLIEIIQRVQKEKIVAIARRVPADRIAAAAEALYEGGIRLMEITFDQADPECLRLTPRMISEVRARFSDMLVGAGTVISRDQARAAAEAGAKFVLAPNVDGDVIDECLKRGICAIPGALTPTEIVQAHKLGAAMVKLFPAGNLGCGYIKAVRGPISHIPLMAVGGVDRGNLADFFNAGIQAVGIGSNIVDNKLIAQGRYDELAALAADYIQGIKEATA
jgi:2-dehydro-3-deoxyphosphogluconate aldolase/(4S)-4-hydroxy-2-oxoglutarate aldolase